MRLSVPGNLLLLGEYAVLEEGGMGLAVAVERRIRVSLEPGKTLQVVGAWPGGGFSWTRGRPSTSRLVSETVRVVEGWLRGRGAPGAGALVEIDSCAFFDSTGRKAGIGSSAAVTVGLTSALLSAAGVSRAERDRVIPRLALEAHRVAQDGRGSGYDVLCSCHGGMGLFHGGASPSWEPCRLSWNPLILLFPGPAPVSSSEAAGRRDAWKKANPDAARAFLAQSNSAVRGFAAAASAEEAAGHFDACRALGIALGDAIGVPARLAAPAGFDARWCKAVGAGNETGVCLLGADAGTAGAEAGRGVQISTEGIVWEE